jgi:hypothetical protein
MCIVDMCWFERGKISSQVKIKGVCLGADVSPSASYLEKHPK